MTTYVPRPISLFNHVWHNLINHHQVSVEYRPLERFIVTKIAFSGAYAKCRRPPQGITKLGVGVRGVAGGGGFGRVQRFRDSS